MIKLNNTYSPLPYALLQGEDKVIINVLDGHPLPCALPLEEDISSNSDKSAHPRPDPHYGDEEDCKLMIRSAYPRHGHIHYVHAIADICFKNDDHGH